MSLATDIADLVTDAINSAPVGTFSMPADAVRRVLPLYELTDFTEADGSATAEPKVTVVPRTVEIARNDRGSDMADITVDIGVQRRVSDIDAEVASLGDLLDEIIDYMRGRQLGSAKWTSGRIEAIAADEHLLEHRIFTGVVSLTYRVGLK
jgi:hypothetical protein